jgi:hypothetical protein
LLAGEVVREPPLVFWVGADVPQQTLGWWADWSKTGWFIRLVSPLVVLGRLDLNVALSFVICLPWLARQAAP